MALEDPFGKPSIPPSSTVKSKASLKNINSKPAAPAKPVKPNNSRVTARQRVQAGLRPWSVRTDAGASFGGMTERQWIKANNDAMQTLRDNPGADPTEIVKGYMPQANEQEVYQLANDAWDTYDDSGRYKHTQPTALRYARAHTVASEQQWINNGRASGHDAKSNVIDDIRATDQTWGPAHVDIQDISMSGSEPFINIPVLKTQNPQQMTALLDKAKRDGWTIEQLQESLYDLADDGDIYPDKYLQEAGKPGVRPGFQKDFLVGNVHERSRQFNLLGPGSEGKGTFNPQLGRGEYALDLRGLRKELGEYPVADFADDLRSFRSRSTTTLKLGIPLTEAQDLSGSKGLVERLIKPDVLGAIDDEAVDQGLRPKNRKATRYHAGLPIDGKDVKRVAGDIAGNWRGGIALGALDGASREVGVKVGQGDYTGAATEFGKTYLTGAALEKGFRAAGSVLSKKLPGIAARAGAGSAGSGGLATPVMATIGAVELADGLVEGFTGKDTISHVYDGMVRPYYQQTTGDTRTEEQIQSNLSGPKRVYGSDKPKPTKPQMTKEAVAAASKHLSKVVPEVKPEAPTPTVKPTVKPTVTPTVKPQQKPGWQKALDQAGSWIKGKLGW